MMFKKFLAATALPLLSSAVTLQEAIGGNPDLSSLGTLLKGDQASMTAISNAKNITLLAPSNSAIAAFLNSTMGRDMTTMPGAVGALLSYHVLNGSWTSAQLMNGSQFVPSYLMDNAYTHVDGGQVVEIIKTGSRVSVVSGLLQNSTVTQADIAFDNGQIHIINSLLTIPTTINSTLIEAGLTSLWGAVNATGSFTKIEAMRNLTIFAPNNDAFSQVGSVLANASIDDLSKVLTYHIVAGEMPLYSTDITSNMTIKAADGMDLNVRVNNGSIFVNGAKVVVPNVLVANGVVHVIDQLLNPMNTTATPTGTKGTPQFSGASSVSNAPFTSGVPSASRTTGAGAQATSTSSQGAGARVTPAFMMPIKGGAGGLAGAFVGVVGAAALLV